MGLSPERRLVVKHTFYEVVDKPGNRIRAFTDTVVESLRSREEEEENNDEVEDENAQMKQAAPEVPLSSFPSQPSRGSQMYCDLQVGKSHGIRRRIASDPQQAPIVVHLDSAVAPQKQAPANVMRGLPLSLDTRLERTELVSAVGPPGAHPALPSHMCKAPARSGGKLELSACLPSDSWAGGKSNLRQSSGLQSGQMLGHSSLSAGAPDAARQVVPVQQNSQMLLHLSSGPDCDLLPRGGQTLACDSDQRSDLPVPQLSSTLSESSLATAANGLPMTTVMLRNLPNRYTRADLLAMLDEEGFAARYTFVYLPIDFKTHSGLGYAFVDLTEPDVAERLRRHFEGFSRWCIQSDKVCTVSWSHQEQQGLAAHIKRYRNSPVMHGSVPDDWKPMLFQDGQPVPFPPPQRKLRAPQLRPAP
mmetsp:Transcript_9027/g.14601  ORF Transcript_9027/g.14601 Transcript_9027/m.14601 type:complete len:417 (+) Transcript_9027:90-1340(+)|eukprot:CAMPEP_0169128266 /NCGR_PEP_ID=MMETSP1015-20121227/36471_1 /TAXON_ID=342587 /ORGANISM="Karlodinium micrum, Strain CCMP2283" /LENGTH=416 /DNA_ID=CAMNT_0009192147 /DNA_START=135 /DNA_END=1385 /DNA_ORIENTATION=-